MSPTIVDLQLTEGITYVICRPVHKMIMPTGLKSELMMLIKRLLFIVL